MLALSEFSFDTKFCFFFVSIITNWLKTSLLTILLNYHLQEWRWIWFILTNAHKINWWEIQETSSNRNDSNQCPRRAVAVIWLGISRNQNTINMYTCYIDTHIWMNGTVSEKWLRIYKKDTLFYWLITVP